jgi:hypothetical protein
MNQSSHSINISGKSTFIKSEITSGHRYGAAPPDVTELRQLLEEHRAELVRLGGRRAARVECRIEEIGEEIEKAEPRASTVRSAWESVLDVLKGGAAGAESVAKITEVVRSLSGA